MRARPLSLRPNVEQYKKQAKDLLRACTSADQGAVQAWAESWFEGCADQSVETEGRLRGIGATERLRTSIRAPEIERLEKEIQSRILSKPEHRLADAQFFIAREHG